MHNRISKIITVWILALSISACGAFEIGIEPVAPGGSSNEVDWRATAETFQAEATRVSGSTPLRVEIPAPVGGWTALLDSQAGSLVLESPDEKQFPIFEEDSTVRTVEWSPNGEYLLAVQYHFEADDANPLPSADKPLEIWQLRVNNSAVEPPVQIFQSSAQSSEEGYFPEQIEFGAWSPDGRYVPFWVGPVGASIRADGLPLWIAELQAGQSTLLADVALLDQNYQSWAPDSSGLAFVAGGGRSAQVGKWLELYDTGMAQATTVVSETEQVPGIVAWSPQGDWIAYAAVAAEKTGPEWESLMTFDNEAIAARRIYLLNPVTNETRRLDESETFQDSPLWSDDDSTLYYVQRNDEGLVLMAFDITTGEATMIKGSQRPLPEMVGYYGQSNWQEMWASRP